MQIAAAAPQYLVPGDVPEDVLEREKAVYRQQMAEEEAQKDEKKRKPENVIEKIIEGKVRKFCETVCLMEQEYIRDGDKRIKQLVEETGKKLGVKITVKRFERFAIGE